MFKVGDRVVDHQVEMVFDHVWYGTVVGVGKKVVQVVWDCDGPESGWVDTAYVDELRLKDDNENR